MHLFHENRLLHFARQPFGNRITSVGKAANEAEAAKEATPKANIDTSQLRVNKRSIRSGEPTRATAGARGVAGQTGDATKSRTNAPELGNIDQSAVNRLQGLNPDGSPRFLVDGSRAPGNMTEAEARQSVQDNRGNVQQAFNQVGTDSARLLDPTSQVNRDRQRKKEIDDINITKLVQVGTDEDGNAIMRNIPDPGATAKAREDAKNRFTVEDQQAQQAAMNSEAATQAPQTTVGGATDPAADVPPVPNPEDVTSVLSPEQQEQAGVYAPLLQAIQTKLQLAQQQMGDTTAADQIAALTANYKSSMDTMLESIRGDTQDLVERQHQNQLDSAERLQKQEERMLKLQQARQQSEMRRGIRDQIIQNERNRKDQMLGLGLESGWFSSTRSARVIEALEQGNRIVADMRTDLAFSNEFYANKMLEVEENYHANVEKAHEARTAAELNLKQQMLERAAEIDRDVFNTKKGQIEAKQKQKDDYIKLLGDLAGEEADALVKENEHAIEQMNLAQKEHTDGQKQLWKEAMDYINKFGTQNKEQLSRYEKQMGLPAGSLTNQKTLAELKKRGGAGGKGVNMDSVVSYVEGERQFMSSRFPNMSGEEIDKIILNNYSFAHDKEESLAMADYMSRNNLTRPGIGPIGPDGQRPRQPRAEPYHIPITKAPLTKVEIGVNSLDDELDSLFD